MGKRLYEMGKVIKQTHGDVSSMSAKGKRRSSLSMKMSERLVHRRQVPSQATIRERTG
jgi:hypothetical protein